MSVKLYTPDSNVIVHETKVDFRRRVVQRQINLVQYDKSMPVIAVKLCSNGNEYVLPENASAYIRFGKRDHTYVYNECLGCDQTRTIVYFAITDQMTVFYGEHTPIVELRIGDTVAGSGSIPIWIDRNPIQNGDTESKSDLSVFEKAIEAAQKIDAKLPTDLGASATNLHLLTGATKLGGGINLSGFEWDEATKTLKASGGGASVSPCLNLMDMSVEQPVVRTSITEEEKNNVEKGLYNSVVYSDPSSDIYDLSRFFPETAMIVNGNLAFSTYNFSVDETSDKATVLSSSVYGLNISEEKNEDGTYPITIEKMDEAFFGGGGASVSPCLNLLSPDTQSVRTSITEEEKNNLDKGLYNSVLYFDESAGPLGFISTYFPEPLTSFNDNIKFSIFNFTADEATETITITGSSIYSIIIDVPNKNEDGTYPIYIRKMTEAPFSGGGGGGSADTSTMTEKKVAIVEADATEDVPFIQQYHGIYGLYRITDCSITVTNDDRDDILFVGYPLIPRDTEGIGFLVGSIYMGTHVPLSLRQNFNYSFVGTGTYKFTNGKIDATPYGCVGNMTFGGLALLAGRETTSDAITTAIENGWRSGVDYKVTFMTLKYYFKEKVDNHGLTKTFIGYVDGDTSNKLKLSGLFDGKQGTAVLEKDSSGTWVSNTPIEYVGEKATHHHTLAIKENGRIVFATNRELESATAATSLKTLISTFAGTTTAGFGDYILLTVDTAAKLKKQDGTEVDLSTLTAQILDWVK